GFHGLDAAVPLTGVVVAGVDNHGFGRRAREEVARQLFDALFRDADDRDFAEARRVAGRYGFGACLGREAGQRFRTTRVSDRNLMAQRAQPARERAPDVASTNDPDFHAASFVPAVPHAVARRKTERQQKCRHGESFSLWSFLPNELGTPVLTTQIAGSKE